MAPIVCIPPQNYVKSATPSSMTSLGEMAHHIFNKYLIVESRDGRSRTFVDGMGSGVVVNITSDNVTFEGFSVQNGEIGIKLTGNNSVINDNAIRNIVSGVTGSSSSGRHAEAGGNSYGNNDLTL
jgi:hypothetical protein